MEPPRELLKPPLAVEPPLPVEPPLALEPPLPVEPPREPPLAVEPQLAVGLRLDGETHCHAGHTHGLKQPLARSMSSMPWMRSPEAA